MMALAFLAGLWTASRRSLRVGIAADTILDLGPWLIIGGILGARLFYVVSFWREQFAGQPFGELFKVWRGGLVYYGGFIGASIACIVYAQWKKLPMWKLGDIMAPSIALGSAIGRIGCLLNGCCYGRVCNLPWAIHFPPGNQTYPYGVHPTEIYDALLNMTLYVTLAWLYRRKKFDGQVFAVYLIGYAVFRSIGEVFRGDYPERYLGGWATPAQLISVPILIAGFALLAILPRLRSMPAAGPQVGPPK